MFKLPFDIPESDQKILLKDSIFCTGSCFSDTIGNELSDHKFNVEVNPLGITYNPYSILNNLKSLISNGVDPNNFIKNGSVYFHWDTHSSISSMDISRFKELLANRSVASKRSLLNADWIFITFGTSYVYKYLPTNKLVANCHKVSQNEFKKLKLSSQEIVDIYQETFTLLKSANPKLKTILTVSPVRHVRDGLVNNNYSKATLLEAVHEIVNSNENTYYFPAYEMMIDELRDYRFYKSDMIHPSDQAIEYIWEKFIATYMNVGVQNFIKQWSRIRRSLKHRPFHPESPDHQHFLKATMNQLKELEHQVDVSKEMTTLKNQLI